MNILKKIYNSLFNAKKRTLFLAKHGIYNKMEDKKYIKKLFNATFKYELDLENPKTFNEKLQWLKLYDRNVMYKNMVDKIEVKKIVSEKIGEKYIIPTIAIFNDFDEIDFKSLPTKFVIKCSHDSGGLEIVNNKENINIKKLKKKINKSFKSNYFYSCREWPYKDIKPRIIIEKNIGKNLNDFKIFCFNGEPKFTLVCSNRKGNFKNTNFYDTNWNLLPFTRSNHANDKNELKKPKNYNEMLSIAKKLSQGIPFVRVDLYNLDGCIYFGELTFYPSGGFEGFKPEKWDKIIGDMVDISVVRK